MECDPGRGRLLRETGKFETQTQFDGAPTGLGLVYLNWQAAVGPEQLKQLPGPLRVRRAHDLGWLPGCWLKSDHDRYAAERDKPKREPVRRVGGQVDLGYHLCG